MAKFKAIAVMSVRLELEIEAETQEEANQLAMDADGGEFSECKDEEYGEMYISSVSPMSSSD